MKKWIAQLLFCFSLFSMHLSLKAQHCVWANASICSAGMSTGAVAFSVSCDRFGNSYTAGSFYGDSMTVGSAVVYNSDTSGCDIFVAKYDPSGGLIWLKRFGGVYYDLCYQAIADLDGNLYLTGSFEQSITFGTSAFTSASMSDIFIAKLDPNGNSIWAKHVIGSAGYNPHSVSIALDNIGHVIIAGLADSTVIFDSTHIINGFNCMFLAEYDTMGNVQWVKVAGVQEPRHVTTDNFGNIFVTGNFHRDTVRFDGVYITGTMINSGFLVKYNNAGNAVWARSEKGTEWAEGSNVATDAQGNAFTCGYYGGPALSIGSASFPNPDSNHEDIFIVKYDSSGNVLWVRDGTGPGSGDGYPFGIATDQSGNVLVSGRCDSLAITFGTTTVMHATCFIVKYTGSGSLATLWKPDTGFLEPVAITINNTGNLLVGGDTGPPILQMDSVIITVPSFSSFSMILVKFDGLSLGVEQREKKLPNVQVYPNPAGNLLSISAGVPIKSITITNYLGQTVYSGTYSSDTVWVDISRLQPGNYIAGINGVVFRQFTKL